ncbi:MAG: DUF3883 domain-containing protein [Gammaproteobacteria bacterium]|nr:DUF3883 domain-containing protein [Gammaproteobacteria bacterium]
MESLKGKYWLYNKESILIEKPLSEILLNDLNDDYNKDHNNTEKLVKVLELKLNKVSEFEEETGLKVVNREKYEKWMNAQSDDSSENNEESVWSPDVSPEEANISIDESDFQDHSQEDLSGQGTKESSETDDADNNGDNSNKPKDSKAIGDWGESIANEYLVRKFPNNEVVWLNKSGNVGKGYDFVIRDNGEDIAYYEVKSKTDEVPQLFLISGTQWGWARKLHNSKKGEMYKILLISNAGKKEPKVREIVNPIELWNSGELYADPVKIEL